MGQQKSDAWDLKNVLDLIFSVLFKLANN